MAAIPTDGASHAVHLSTNDTVTATITRTITTTNSDGHAATVYSSTDVKSVIVDSDPNNEASSAAQKHASVTHVEHTERVVAEHSGGLNSAILGGSHFGDHEDDETTADVAVQQLLSDMLRAGLKPKGQNKSPQKTAQENNANPMRQARDAGNDLAKNKKEKGRVGDKEDRKNKEQGRKLEKSD